MELTLRPRTIVVALSVEKDGGAIGSATLLG